MLIRNLVINPKYCDVECIANACGFEISFKSKDLIFTSSNIEREEL